MLLLILVASASCCSPGTPFYPKEGLPKWIEDSLTTFTLTSTTTTTEEPILPTPEALVEETSPTSTGQTTTITWRQISQVQQQNNYRPQLPDSFSEIYRRLEQQNMQHLVAVEPEGQRPPWV